MASQRNARGAPVKLQPAIQRSSKIYPLVCSIPLTHEQLPAYFPAPLLHLYSSCRVSTTVVQMQADSTMLPALHMMMLHVRNHNDMTLIILAVSHHARISLPLHTSGMTWFLWGVWVPCLK